MAEQWLSIVEYARTFQVSDMTVRRRIKTGRLHAVLKEGKYFIPVPHGENRAFAGEGETTYATGTKPRMEPDQRPPSVASPYSRRPSEMTVIKSSQTQPTSYIQSFSPPLENPQPVVIRPNLQPMQQRDTHQRDYGDEGPDSMLPQNLSRPLAAQDTSLVDTRALLAFCEATLRKLNDSERRTVEKFKSKLEALEANLSTRDLEIRSLRQQVEDLQLLVKILERKS